VRFPKRERAVAAAVKSVRLKAGLKQIHLSQALGRSDNYISKIERLEKTNISLGELEAIAKECGVSSLELIRMAMR
jgi:transcriptional regulator with XRE-family HTH domain